MENKWEKVFRAIFPSPFTIAIFLTLITFVLAFFITQPPKEGSHFIQLLSFWEKGLWDASLLTFAFQMMCMLVFGYVLALSTPISRFISIGTRYCNNTAKAAAIVTFLTLLVSFFNWGLGLVFGAIFARKVGEHASANQIKLNYPLIGAAGYSGLMVWHGGISGSAPIKIAEEGHFLADKIGVISQEQTIFSSMNLWVSTFLLICLPFLMYYLGKKNSGSEIKIKPKTKEESIAIVGAEKLDHSTWLATIFGGIILFYIFYHTFILPERFSFKFLTPNYINLTLLALGILLHGNFFRFLKAADNAIVSASGILIQFPLYFGIMGIMAHSGLTKIFSDFFVNISNASSFPIFTFFSAGAVNIFIPSGGGQWAIQGPIVIDAALQLGADIPKTVMALAYGDQLTNMLQPFWALPLLGITGLKAKEILPYSTIILLAGLLIFTAGLLIF